MKTFMYEWHLVTDGDKSTEFKIEFWNQPKKGVRKSCAKRLFYSNFLFHFHFNFFGIFVELISFKTKKQCLYISTYVINALYKYIPNKNKPSYEKGASTMYLLRYNLPKKSICVHSSQLTVFSLNVI